MLKKEKKLVATQTELRNWKYDSHLKFDFPILYKYWTGKVDNDNTLHNLISICYAMVGWNEFITIYLGYFLDNDKNDFPKCPFIYI